MTATVSIIPCHPLRNTLVAAHVPPETAGARAVYVDDMRSSLRFGAPQGGRWADRVYTLPYSPFGIQIGSVLTGDRPWSLQELDSFADYVGAPLGSAATVLAGGTDVPFTDVHTVFSALPDGASCVFSSYGLAGNWWAMQLRLATPAFIDAVARKCGLPRAPGRIVFLNAHAIPGVLKVAFDLAHTADSYRYEASRSTLPEFDLGQTTGDAYWRGPVSRFTGRHVVISS